MKRIPLNRLVSYMSLAVAGAVVGCDTHPELGRLDNHTLQSSPAPQPAHTPLWIGQPQPAANTSTSDAPEAVLPESAGMPSSTMPLPGLITLEPIDPVAAATDEFLGETADDQPESMPPNSPQLANAAESQPATAPDGMLASPEQAVPVLPYTPGSGPYAWESPPSAAEAVPPQIIVEQQYVPETVYIPQYYYSPFPYYVPTAIIEYPIIIHHHREICPGVFADDRFFVSHRPPILAGGHNHDHDHDHGGHDPQHGTTGGSGRGSAGTAQRPHTSDPIAGVIPHSPSTSANTRTIVTNQGTTVVLQPPRETAGARQGSASAQGAATPSASANGGQSTTPGRVTPAASARTVSPMVPPAPGVQARSTPSRPQQRPANVRPASADPIAGKMAPDTSPPAPLVKETPKAAAPAVITPTPRPTASAAPSPRIDVTPATPMARPAPVEVPRIAAPAPRVIAPAPRAADPVASRIAPVQPPAPVAPPPVQVAAPHVTAPSPPPPPAPAARSGDAGPGASNSSAPIAGRIR